MRVTVHIQGTTAFTSMARPQIGQPVSGEQAAAQDALNLLRGHGFAIEYSHSNAPPLDSTSAVSKHARLVDWLLQQPETVTSYQAAAAMGWDWWTTENYLEQAYQLGRCGFKAGAGWYAVRSPSAALQTHAAAQISPDQSNPEGA